MTVCEYPSIVSVMVEFRADECHPISKEMRAEVVKLYQAWHRADPIAGHDRQAEQFATSQPSS